MKIRVVLHEGRSEAGRFLVSAPIHVELPSENTGHPLPEYLSYRGKVYQRKHGDPGAIDGYWRVVCYVIPDDQPPVPPLPSVTEGGIRHAATTQVDQRVDRD